MKGKTSTSIKVLTLVVILAAVVFIVGPLGLGLFAVTEEPEAPPGTEAEPVVTETVCPDDDITTFYPRIEDTEAATTTYVAKRVYASNVNDPSDIQSLGSSSTDYPSSGLDLDCGESYYVNSPTNASASGGVLREVITCAGNTVRVTYATNQIDYGEIRVKDIAADSYQSLFSHGTENDGTNATTYSALNSTGVYESVAKDDIAVGTDGSLNYEVLIRCHTARKFMGDGIGKCWAFFDVGSDVEWDEPVVSWNGDALSDDISNVKSNDLLYSQLNAMDYAYPIGDGKEIDNTGGTLAFNIQAASGQDPDTSNDDITIYFGCEGVFKSSQQADTFFVGIATDAATRAAVVQTSTLYTPKLVINIS